MILTLIWAMTARGVIGKDGVLPWHIPEDLKHFREKTRGRVVIMGRKTFDSIGRPLPNRQNWVISRQALTHTDSSVRFFESFLSAYEAAKSELPADCEVFVIGGAQIYEQAFAYADRLCLTLVEGDFGGDAYFSPLDWQKGFKVTSEVRLGSAIPCRVIEAKRER